MLDIQNIGLVELNAQEVQEVDGGHITVDDVIEFAYCVIMCLW